ncbi:MAG: hypothetical protein V2B18_18670, partial [Pseudomonadota bacterium]
MPILRSFVFVIIALIMSAGSLGAQKPSPPYHRFQGISFEPSAAAFDDRNAQVIVLNDKDTFIHRYKLEYGVDGVCLKKKSPLQINLSCAEAAAKLEALAPLGQGCFLASSSFDRNAPEYRRVIRFQIPDDESSDSYKCVRADSLRLDAGGLEKAIRDVTKRKWFKIEGLAVGKDAEHVFFGVRQVGPDHKDPLDVVIVVRCPFRNDQIEAPNAVFQFSTNGLQRPVGLSDLLRDADGGFFILTSSERNDPGRAPFSDSHAGAL